MCDTHTCIVWYNVLIKWHEEMYNKFYSFACVYIHGNWKSKFGLGPWFGTHDSRLRFPRGTRSNRKAYLASKSNFSFGPQFWIHDARSHFWTKHTLRHNTKDLEKILQIHVWIALALIWLCVSVVVLPTMLQRLPLFRMHIHTFQYCPLRHHYGMVLQS